MVVSVAPTPAPCVRAHTPTRGGTCRKRYILMLFAALALGLTVLRGALAHGTRALSSKLAPPGAPRDTSVVEREDGGWEALDVAHVWQQLRASMVGGARAGLQSALDEANEPASDVVEVLGGGGGGDEEADGVEAPPRPNVSSTWSRAEPHGAHASPSLHTTSPPASAAPATPSTAAGRRRKQKHLMRVANVTVEDMLRRTHAIPYWRPERQHAPMSASERIANVHRTCFDPAHSSVLVNTSVFDTVLWRMARVVEHILPGDPDLLVYQSVLTGAACSPHALLPASVVLATHMTIERLPVLRALASMWQGCISLSLLTCAAEDVVTVVRAVAQDAVLRSSLALHVVIGAKGLYPFNTMRNSAVEPWQHAYETDGAIALDRRTPTMLVQSRVPLPWPRHRSTCKRAAVTASDVRHMLPSDAPWMFTIDIDAVPAANASVFAQAMAHASRHVASSAAVFAVAPFELRSSAPGQLETFLAVSGPQPPLLARLDRLRRAYASRRVRIFHTDRTTRAYQGRMPVSAWLHAKLPTILQQDALPIEYSLYFEPYFIAKPPFPRFDEFFRGRGMSKSSWFLAHVATGEFSMFLLSGVFLLCRSDFDDHHRAGLRAAPKVSRVENKLYMLQMMLGALQRGDVCTMYAEREQDLRVLAARGSSTHRGAAERVREMAPDK